MYKSNETRFNSIREMWVRSMPARVPEDPVGSLLKHQAATQQVMMAVHPDPKALRAMQQKAYLTCCLPCFCCVPLQVLKGIPCHLFCGDLSRFQAFAKDRAFILTDGGIMFHLENGAQQFTHLGWCRDEGEVFDEQEVFVLFDDDFSLEESDSTSDCVFPNRSLALSVRGAVVARIDYAANVSAFVEAVKEQTAKVQQASAIDQLTRDVHNLILDYHVWLSSKAEPKPADAATIRHEDNLSNMQFEAKMYYSNLMDKISAAHERSRIAAASVLAAPVSHGDMVRDADNVSALGVDAVQDVLRELGFYEKYGTIFLKRGVDGALLSVIDDAALEELGVTSSLDRKTILGWVVRQRMLPTVTALAVV